MDHQGSPERLIDLFKEPAFGFANFNYYFKFYWFLLKSLLFLFLSVYFGFNLLSFSSFLRWKLTSLILNLSSFLIYTLNAIKFSLSLFSLYATNFDKLFLHFYFIQYSFDNSWYSSLIHVIFRSVSFNLHLLWDFSVIIVIDL